MVAVTPPPSSLQIRTASLPPASPVNVKMSDALEEMTVVLDEMSDVLRPRDSTTPKARAMADVAAAGLAAFKGFVAVHESQPAKAEGAEAPVVSTAAKRSRIPRFV